MGERILARPVRLALLVLAALVLAGCASNTGTPTPSTAVSSTPSTPTTGGSTTQPCDATATTVDAAWKAESPRVKIQTSKGDITVELAMERAPVTSANFLKLVRSGYYDGQSFYRVSKDFVIQGGSRSGAPDHIKDEFNPTQRHSAAGILSMATAGPDTGSSEFFITLGPAARLDDRHAVFGHVVEGMDVVNAIGALYPSNAQNDGPPTETVGITKASEVAAGTFAASHGVGVHPVLTEKKGQAGRAETFAVVLENTGTTRDAVGLRATIPTGWTCSVNDRPVIPAGTGRVVFLSLTPPAGASGSVDVPIQAVSAWSGTGEAASGVKVTIAQLGADVKQGDKVTANYAGLLPDGRLFDASFQSVGTDPGQPKFNTTGGWQPHPSYATFPFTVGSGVIAGFTNLAKTAKAGETVTAYIPAKDAYATGDMYQRPLTGRDLIFELEIVKVG